MARRARLVLGPLLGLLGLVQGAAAGVIDATWNPGVGEWTDASWTFVPASPATYPDNGSGDFFNVRIDGGAAAPSQVLLAGRAVQVDRLEVSGADLLRLDLAAGFVLTQDDARPGSGELVVARGGVLAGAGFLIGTGEGPRAMRLDNSGTILADTAFFPPTGPLLIDPSGPDPGLTPVSNDGILSALGSRLILKDSFVKQSPGGLVVSGGASPALAEVVLEDSIIQGGRVELRTCAFPPCSELLLNRGSVVQGTGLTIEQSASVRVLASAAPGGTLPAEMSIEGGSVFVEGGPINPVRLDLDSGPGPAHVINLANPGNPASPGLIFTNVGLLTPGKSIIRIVDGDVTLANPGGIAARPGGIVLGGAEPADALILSDTPLPAGRILTIGPGTSVTNLRGRSGRIGGFRDVPPDVVGPAVIVVGSAALAIGESPDRGLVAVNPGRIEIAELANEGGLVEAYAGGTLALDQDAFPNAGQVHVHAGGTLELSGDYQQLAEGTLIEGDARVGGRYVQTGGDTTIAPGGTLRAAEVEVRGGGFVGEILSDFLLDGSWDVQLRGLLDFDRINVLDDPDTASPEGSARIADGSRIEVELLFDAQVDDFFDVLIADLVLVDLDLLSVSDPFRDGRSFEASVLALRDPASGALRAALRLTVVPEPGSLALIGLGLAGWAAFARRRSRTTSSGPDRADRGVGERRARGRGETRVRPAG